MYDIYQFFLKTPIAEHVYFELGPCSHAGSLSSSFSTEDFEQVGGSDSALCRFYPSITRSETNKSW